MALGRIGGGVLKDNLERNGSNLNFKKRFNQKSDLYCLDRWDLFEQNNPNTFSGMYQFWIQKQ